MTTLARRLSVCACAAGVAFFSVACRNTAEGFKRDTEENKQKAAIHAGPAVEKASEATAAAARQAADAAQAGAQTVTVKTALLADRRVSSNGINVDTDLATRTVTLKGHVPTKEQKDIAEKIAVDRSAGYHVKNELTISD
jgi:osmotically-inducible protein OsmY